MRSAYRTGLIVAFPFVVWICQPQPLPTREGHRGDAMVGTARRFIGAVRWSPAYCGEAGAGTFGGLRANILMSLLIDKYGWFRMTIHDLSPGRTAGAVLMVAGIVLISRF